MRETRRARGATARRRHPAANVLAAIASAQWAITSEALDGIRDIAARTNLSPEAIEAMRGEPLDNTRTVTIRDGVASIPVRGPLFRYANIITRCSGATSYQDLATDLRAAIDNPGVQAVLLDIDSPGGEVNGCAETAALVRGLGAIKPIDAYISGTGASAAYWIAAACRTVVAANTALVGSIGCIWGMEIVRRNDETIEEYVLVSSQSPKKNMDIRTTDGRADLMVLLDALADEFVGAVAEYRGVTPATVLSDFGQGGMFVGKASIAAGLADRLGNYEELLATLAESGESTGTFATLPNLGGRASTATTSEGSMAKATSPAGRRSAPQGSAAPPADPTATDTTGTTDKSATAPAAAAPEEDPEDLEDGGADDDEENADGTKKKKKDAAPDPDAAVKAERARIKAIGELPGPAALKQTCIDEGVSAADTALRILQADATTPKPNRLAALRQDDAGPHAGVQAANDSTSTSPKAAAKASVDRFYSLTKPQPRTA